MQIYWLGKFPRQGTASQAAEKLSSAVILSEAKNLLVIQISKMQFLRRLRLLRMTVLWEFFSNLFSRAGKKGIGIGFSR